MLKSINYLLPALLALIFAGLSRYPNSCLYFLCILFVANVIGNKIGGEFTNTEIQQEINYFQTSPIARVVKLLSAFIFLGIIGWCLVYVDTVELTRRELLGFSLMTGFITGCFLVTLAHDLLHAHTRFEQGVANLLLVVAGIPHFTNDHLLGHHRLIGLPEDATTAKYNDSFYRCFRQSAWQRIRYSYFTAYKLPTRLCRNVRRQNIGLALCLGLIYGAIVLWATHLGATATFFAVQGFTAYVLYELINYIQHYGLQRNRLPGGKPEVVSLAHSWNCYYKYTNYLLFMLPLHSAHHACPYPRKGADLMGPRLPYVYFVMVAMALIPGLWFRQMNPLVRRQQAVNQRVSEPLLYQ